MTREQEKIEKEKLKNLVPPKNYYGDNYMYSIKYCPGYEGYIPENLNHEVCKFCGSIKYYH
jgi:hypothetical protein